MHKCRGFKPAFFFRVHLGQGKQHDFKIWEKSRTAAKPEREYLADKGYQGIKKIHNNSQTPIKKKRSKKLSKSEKKLNRELAKHRKE